jgi:putative ABC transport system permease protein
MFILRMLLRELRSSYRVNAFFIFNLAIGLTGFLLIQNLSGSVSSQLESRSQSILTADIAVSCRRPFSEAEKKILSNEMATYKHSESIEMFSMLAGPHTSRLVELKAIAANYPLYGDFIFASGRKKPTLSPGHIWVDQDLLLQLEVKKGDSLKIGERFFIIEDLITDDSSGSMRSSALSSQVYMNLDELTSTGLMSRGATVSYTHFYALPESVSYLEVEKNLNLKLVDPGVQVITHKTAAENTGRVIGYLGDYLSLVALVGFCLSALGAIYLFRSLMAKKFYDIAVYISLGMKARRILYLYSAYVLFLGLIAFLISAFVSYFVLPFASDFVSSLTEITLHTSLQLKDLILPLAIATLGSWLFCLPWILRVLTLRPSIIFQESLQGEWKPHPLSYWLIFVVLFLFWLLSVFESHSFKTGSLFSGGFLASIVLLLVIAYSGLIFLRRFKFKRIEIQLAFKNLTRNVTATLTCFISISLGTMLMNLIPQIQNGLLEEVEKPDSNKVPSLFLFDIQPEQVSTLQNFLDSEKKPLQNVSALVRARLLKVNDEDFEKKSVSQARTREEEREFRFRNRGFNLSYRDKISDSETIIKGRPFSGPYKNDDSIPEISVEKNFAERLSLKLGDVLHFDVQGVPLSGKIVNLRSVKWTSFQPNFFIQFQSGVLEEAPSIFLGSILQLGEIEKIQLQNKLVEKFPNISMIDITKTVKKILELANQMAWALKLMAILSLIVGLVVVYSIANHEAYLRERDVFLIKILGLDFARIRIMMRMEFAVLVSAAATLGVLLSYLMSYLLAKMVFDSVWNFSWLLSLGMIVAVILVSLLLTDSATRSILQKKVRI